MNLNCGFLIYVILVSSISTSCDTRDSDAVQVGEYLGSLRISPVSTDDIEALDIARSSFEFASGPGGISRINFRITNSGSKPLWLHGHSIRTPGHLFEYFDSKTSSWVDVSSASCGTGTENHPLKPKESTVISAPLANEGLEQKHRIGVFLATSPTASNHVLVWSDPFLIEPDPTGQTTQAQD